MQTLAQGKDNALGNLFSTHSMDALKAGGVYRSYVVPVGMRRYYALLFMLNNVVHSSPLHSPQCNYEIYPWTAQDVK